MPPNKLKPQGLRRNAETTRPVHSIGDMLASPRVTGELKIVRILISKTELGR